MTHTHVYRLPPPHAMERGDPDRCACGEAKEEASALAKAEADAERLAAALEARTFRRKRIPAHRGEYIEHGFDEEMHDLEEPCDICDAIKAHREP